MKQKGHHFITESYQRNFTDDKGHVWILTSQKRIFNTNPDNSFKEDHFYTVKLPGGGGSLVVEKTLAEIEGGFIGVVNNKILKGQNLSEEDRGYISLFVAAMLTRTKVQRNHFRDTHNNLIKRMEEMQVAFRKNPPKYQMERGDGPSISLDELKQHMQNFDSDESLSTLALLQDTAPIISQMKWSILSAPEGMFFISSDNPFCMCSPERERLYGRRAIGASAGLADSDIEVTFPLTKKHALFAAWENYLPQYVEATPYTVEQINRRTSRTAHNLIASSKGELEEIVSRAQNHEQGSI